MAINRAVRPRRRTRGVSSWISSGISSRISSRFSSGISSRISSSISSTSTTSPHGTRRADSISARTGDPWQSHGVVRDMITIRTLPERPRTTMRPWRRSS
ncbi:hypothetical protein FNV68_27430 [Streptomyces sp. S1D4-23]|nr:hypothetical protein FNV61_26225 [Streptomyces sp. RLB3-6]QDO09478.1 hypothetical protein FNV68_27430 [Streptomyces sp. S1D4-23]